MTNGRAKNKQKGEGRRKTNQSGKYERFLPLIIFQAEWLLLR